MKNKILFFYSFFLISFSFIFSGCDRNHTTSLPGYIEGKYTYISPIYGGIISAIFVDKGDEVKTNQQLFSLEEYPESQDVKMAEARVQEAINQRNKIQENYKLHKIELERKKILSKDGIISKEEFETHNTTFNQTAQELKASEDNIKALQAAEQKARWTSGQRIVQSPIASQVFDIYYRQGEMVTTGSPVLSLIASNQLKIIFFVPEPLLSQLRTHQNIDVVIDGYSQSIKGKIMHISTQAQFTPPVIYSTEERQKLVFRVEAFPLIPNALQKLHPGQPVTVKVQLSNKE